MQQLVLTPSRLVQHEVSLAVYGLLAIGEFLGIDQPHATPDGTH